MPTSISELEHLRSACTALEAEAGIAEAMARAREGRFVPLGIDGEDVSSAAYFADEHDHFREHARDAYFAVPDLELRKRLIAAQRSIESKVKAEARTDLQALQAELAQSAAKAEHLPWTRAAVVAVAAVALGYWTFGNPGALAGVVAGYFLGQGLVASSKRDSLAVQREVQERVDFAKQAAAEHGLWPETFLPSEELDGSRNNDVDLHSAYANVVRRERDA